jgi:hypothetical protein
MYFICVFTKKNGSTRSSLRLWKTTREAAEKEVASVLGEAFHFLAGWIDVVMGQNPAPLGT